MARLPQPGSDTGTWGDVLNDFLVQAHNPDGTVKDVGVIAAKAEDNAVVHNSGDEAVGGIKTYSASPIVPTPTTGTQAANKTYVDTVAGSGAPDATTATKGIVQLAGDLTGTAASPQIASGAIVDADVNASANIAQSKVANLTTDLASKASNADLTAHANDTTVIHGIADTSVLETTAGAQTKVDTHANDTTGAHAASAISFTPTGTVAANNVQAAIAEVASETGSGNMNTATYDPAAISQQVAGISATQTLTNKTITDSTNNVTANGLRSATTTVNVSSATAPTTGQVLTATSGTAATWQSVAGAPDATTSSKGIVQLAGDLSGTAASPQIAAGAIVDADVNVSAAIAESKLNLASDAAAGTASRRTLGTGATQATAGNDARFTTVTHNTQTTSYTLVLADAGKVVEMNVATANTLTVPPNSSVAFAIGTVIGFRQYGAGQVTLTPGSGVTIRSSGGKLKTAVQYSEGTLTKRATDEWVAAGDITT